VGTTTITVDYVEEGPEKPTRGRPTIYPFHLLTEVGARFFVPDGNFKSITECARVRGKEYGWTFRVVKGEKSGTLGTYVWRIEEKEKENEEV